MGEEPERGAGSKPWLFYLLAGTWVEPCNLSELSFTKLGVQWRFKEMMHKKHSQSPSNIGSNCSEQPGGWMLLFLPLPR